MSVVTKSIANKLKYKTSNIAGRPKIKKIMKFKVYECQYRAF